MGIYTNDGIDLSGIQTAIAGLSDTVATIPNATQSGATPRPAGFLGIFGTGLWRTYTDPGSYTWTVPAGITRIRVRVVGGGSGGRYDTHGGCAGGYAHGTFDVTPGDTYAVTVGKGSAASSNPSTPANDGGTSSFGALISATGGIDTEGGHGVGGDFQAKGGTARGRGGAAAGSQVGDGGDTDEGTYWGAGVGGGKGATVKLSGSSIIVGGSPFGRGANSAGKYDGDANPTNALIRFPFDGFTGGGGFGSTLAGPGAGGGQGTSTTQSPAGPGGGAGALGTAGISGGGCCDSSTPGSPGGDGLVVIEF